MAEQEIAHCLEEAEKKITYAQKMIEENWKSYINAPFDSAREHVKKAEGLLVEARQAADAETTSSKAKLASIEAMEGYLCALPSRTAEARGVWYRPTEHNFEEVILTLDRMQAAGFNELYLETWLWGYTIYPSRMAVEKQIEEQHPAFRGWDPLEAFVLEGEKRGIAVHAWLDGFMVGIDPTGGPVLRAYPEWSACSRRQADAQRPMPQRGTGYFWLDITNPNVRQYLLDIVKEIITRYSVAGINLDFMRFPHVDNDWQDGYCFSAYARETFQRDYGKDPLEIRADKQTELWTTWMKWVEQIEDDFVRELYKEIKQINPKIIVSAAPEPGAESEKIGNWSQHVDVVIPQAYFDKAKLIRASVQLHKNELLPGNLVYSGIYPMYAKLGAHETVEQLLAAREIDCGTVIFAFGQATDETIRALRQGPWRIDAISTGMYPLGAVQAALNAMKTDVEQVYLPRQAVHEKMANDLVGRVDSLLSILQRHEVEELYALLDEKIEACKQLLLKASEEETIHASVVQQLMNTLTEVQEILCYSEIKQVK
ncbi:family 10 glycosylhydrolase [Paenibacillus qinlingensis]|uniref:Uncharacterized lipoprotein YddW (UPF0748 family) n=1 Tax=Paenibacillus qinlingensis TaxID=1837343 RepID=A0ABU1NSQ2_9BACL|nr:family 10 glycosylhydrolase [Paenibacillus qinlingensis]MDR6550510.1 uncharacterized lipoprotein YddW (UPF0748 family) [Paenibacillus qinlingensis]